MYKIEISSFWIDIIGKTVMCSVIAIVTFTIAIKLIRMVKHDWHDEAFSMNILLLISVLVLLSITFNAIYMILNIWGILEISVV
jgi:hypothetical protein